MSVIQFNGSGVLFRGDTASFCAAHCVCDDPTPPPPVDPGTTCTTCKSSKNCAFSGDCTPTTLRVSFSGTAQRTACLACGTGGSIKVTTGSLTGVYDLQQNPSNPCHWIFVDSTPTMVATAYAGAACTSTSSPTTELRIEAHRDSTGLDLIAYLRIFANGTYADFIVFSGRYAIGKQNFPNTFTLAATSATDDSECLGWQQGLGGRLGWGGTAILTVCPPVPHVCECHDDYTCLWAKGIAIPTDVPDFVYSVCQDDLAPLPNGCTKTDVYVPFNITCEWITGTVSVGSVNNLKVKIHWYNEGDTHATNGCGYYLYLYAVTGGGDVEKAVYYLNSIYPTGIYTIVDPLYPGFPLTLTVLAECNDPTVMTPAPTTCPLTGQPTAVSLTGWKDIYIGPDIDFGSSTPPPEWDGTLVKTADCRYDSVPASGATIYPSGYPFDVGYLQLVGGETPPYWQIDLWTGSGSPTIRVWSGKKYTGDSPLGVYLNDGTATSATPMTITVS